MSIRDTILKAQDLPSEEVEVKEWGVTFTLRGLTAGQVGDFYDRVTRYDGDGLRIDRRLWGVELLMACAYDGDKPVFDRADRDPLLDKPSSVITRLASTAAKLSGLSGDDDEAVEDFVPDPS